MNTTLFDSPTPTASPLLGGVAEMHSVLDRLHASPLGSAHGPIASTVVEVDRAIRRLEALKLKLLACADKAGVAQDAGFTGTEAWAAKQTTTSHTTAARQVALARELDDSHIATKTALDDGLVSPAHAAVIVGASLALPSGVSDQQREAVETALVAKAQHYTADQLRRMARRAVEAIEPDQLVVDAHENDLVRSEEEQTLAKASFSFHDNEDGTTTGHFTVPTTRFAHLHKILDTMTAPRRMREGVAAPGDRSFDWRNRRGLAFVELLEHLPTDHLHHKSAATLVVTLELETLTGALKAAQLDTGQSLSAGEARRLACGAGIIPAVLGKQSVPLDLGHEARTFSQAQRIAAGLKHDACAAEGCERHLRLVRASPSTPLGARWADRPRQRRAPVPLAPPACARPHLPTHLAPGRHRQLQRHQRRQM